MKDNKLRAIHDDASEVEGGGGSIRESQDHVTEWRGKKKRGRNTSGQPASQFGRGFQCTCARAAKKVIYDPRSSKYHSKWTSSESVFDGGNN